MALLDNFNRANENPLTTTNWGAMSPGAGAGMQLVSNQAACAAGSGGTSESGWKTAFGPDCWSQVVFAAASGDKFYLTVRCSTLVYATRTGYMMQWDDAPGTCEILRMNGNGTLTSLASASTAPVANDTVQLRAVGSTITVLRNSVTVVSAEDATYGAAGYSGIGIRRTSGNAGRLDNFDAETIPPVSTWVPKSVMLAAARDAWDKRRSGIFVPKLWKPRKPELVLG